MNGAFRIHIFAGLLPHTSKNLARFAAWIDSPKSFFNKYRSPTGLKTSIFDGVLSPGDFHHSVQDGTSGAAVDSGKSHRRNAFFTFLTVVGSHY